MTTLIGNAPSPTPRGPGRPSLPEHLKRSRVVKICLTATEFDACLQAAEATGVSLSDLFRTRILDSLHRTTV